MSKKNGYFQLIIKDDGIYIKVFPSVEGGSQVRYEDISMYLTLIHVKDFNAKVLNDAIKGMRAIAEVKIGNQTILPQDERVILNVSNDKMTVIGRFYPPTTGGVLMKKDDIVSEMLKAKVKFGLIEANVEGFLKSRPYCTNILLAKGMEPVQGSNAEIIYNFNTDKNSKPKMNEDGSVDFHKLDILSNVSKGDVLATLKPVNYGKQGIEVTGIPIKPNKVTNLVFKYGKNIHISEDGRTLISDVAGHVHLEGDKVIVSDTYEVPADVDASTGDINYEGNVHVKGNVITGFTVVAKGDIEVDGVVEGATLISDGQIILKRGIQGMNRGKLIAKSNVVAKFIESSEVKAGGYVSTGAALHSKIAATGEIIVDGRNGSVTGGELRSGTMISLKTAGSTMGTHTLLEVGIDPALVDEYHELETKIDAMESDKEKLFQIVNLLTKKLAAGERLTEDKVKYLRAARDNSANIEKELKDLVERYERLQIEIENSDGGKIKVSNMVYPGVKIVISNVVYFVRTNQQYCQFIRDKADIKMNPL